MTEQGNLPQPPIPPPKQPMSTKGWMIRFLIGILIVGVIIAVIAGANKGDKKTTTTQKPQTTTTQEQKPQNTQPSNAAPYTPPATTWQNVINVKGSTAKRTATFHLGSGEKKLLYAVSGTYVVCSIYIVKAGDSLDVSGGFPEVSIDEVGSGETVLVQTPGDYYLDINSANCSWEVTIQEKK